ncbi:MAG TPA: YCF48-related protein [Blastocatellia bacterium]|nr:YCF48-related protein [Blastocatellia bacterium]
MTTQIRYLSLALILISSVLLTASIAQPARDNDYDRAVQTTGPFGGDVTAMAIDPRSADRIWIGASDGQIFRSTDGGKGWTQMRPGVKATGSAVTVLLLDGEKPGVIYVGMKPLLDLNEEASGGGVFVSEDDGQSWSLLEGMRGRSVRAMNQSTKDPNAMVVAARDGVYYTTDRGKSWKRITPTNDPELKGFHSVAIDPRDANVIYVGTHHLPWKTTDAGKTWKRAASKERGMIDDSDIFAIHIDQSNPDTVLMSACSGIYRSRDASETWTKLQGIPYTSRRTHVIYQHPTKPQVIFAGTTEGLWVSTDGGKPDSWRRMTSQRTVINAVAVHPDRPERVLLGVDDVGIMVSVDSGESYEASNAGFINRQVRAVVADKAERGRVYAGVIFDRANGGLFVSEDGGAAWRQSTNGMGARDVYSIYQSDSNPATIYAGTNNGLFRSDDRGRNWAQVKKAQVKAAAKSRKASKLEKDTLVDLQNQVFAIMPFTPILSASNSGKGDSQPGPAQPTTSGWMVASTWNGLFITEDEKKGWRESKFAKALNRTGGNAAAQIKVNAVVTNQKLPGALFVGTDEGLFVSRDNGVSFQHLALPDAARRIRVVVCDPRDPETIYVGAVAGFFRSTDGGRSWESRGGGMPQGGNISAIAVGASNPDELYLSDESRGVLYHSKDRGTNWEKVDISHAPSLKLWALASDPFDGKRIYAGSFSGGVYVMSRK